MDIIFIGVYNSKQKDKLDHLVSNFNSLELVWDFQNYKLESEEGISLLEEKFNLEAIGILIKKDEKKPFSSYPLISEITDFVINQEVEKPILMNFFEALKSLNIDKLIIAFANEWDRESLIRLENTHFNEITNRINNLYVWCDCYVNLENNSEIRIDYYPLVLDVKETRSL